MLMTLKVRFYNTFHTPSFWSEHLVGYNLLQRNIHYERYNSVGIHNWKLNVMMSHNQFIFPIKNYMKPPYLVWGQWNPTIPHMLGLYLYLSEFKQGSGKGCYISLQVIRVYSQIIS